MKTNDQIKQKNLTPRIVKTKSNMIEDIRNANVQ